MEQDDKLPVAGMHFGGTCLTYPSSVTPGGGGGVLAVYITGMSDRASYCEPI